MPSSWVKHVLPTTARPVQVAPCRSSPPGKHARNGPSAEGVRSATRIVAERGRVRTHKTTVPLPLSHYLQLRNDGKSIGPFNSRQLVARAARSRATPAPMMLRASSPVAAPGAPGCPTCKAPPSHPSPALLALGPQGPFHAARATRRPRPWPPRHRSISEDHQEGRWRGGRSTALADSGLMEAFRSSALAVPELLSPASSIPTRSHGRRSPSRSEPCVARSCCEILGIGRVCSEPAP